LETSKRTKFGEDLVLTVLMKIMPITTQSLFVFVQTPFESHLKPGVHRRNILTGPIHDKTKANKWKGDKILTLLCLEMSNVTYIQMPNTIIEVAMKASLMNLIECFHLFC
jgi:hypothetical protein